MDFTLDDAQRTIQDLARQILGTESTVDRHRALEAADTWFDESSWLALAGAGLLGVTTPESLGGLGLDFSCAGLVLEEIGSTAAKVPFLGTAVGMTIASELDPAGIGAAWAPDVLAGRAVIAVALPQTGDAVDIVGGRLTGRVSLVDGATTPTQIVVVATDESGAPAVFAVDAGEQGVGLVAQPAHLGAPFLRLDFDGVPATRLGGPEAAERLRQLMVGGLCSLAAGAAGAALQLTGGYVRERVQFDRALATFQAVSQRSADIYIDVKAIRLTTRQATWRLGAHLPAAEQVAIAKFWACEGGRRVTFAAQHLHGGIGVDRDYPLFRFYLQLRRVDLTLGTAPEQLRQLGALLAAEPV